VAVALLAVAVVLDLPDVLPEPETDDHTSDRMVLCRYMRSRSSDSRCSSYHPIIHVFRPVTALQRFMFVKI